MELQQKHWKRDTDRLWTVSPFDVRGAAALAAEIARHGANESLRQAAAQALPSLRGACSKTSDQMSRTSRGGASAPSATRCMRSTCRAGERAAVPASEQQHRQLLGLPPERHWVIPEIQPGYKRAAKRLHPDAGGSRGNSPTSAARDALMKRK